MKIFNSQSESLKMPGEGNKPYFQDIGGLDIRTIRVTGRNSHVMHLMQRENMSICNIGKLTVYEIETIKPCPTVLQYSRNCNQLDL